LARLDLGHDPSKRILVASYSDMLSIKHSLDCRLIINSSWYQEIFPDTILSTKHNQKSKFLTTSTVLDLPLLLAAPLLVKVGII